MAGGQRHLDVWHGSQLCHFLVWPVLGKAYDISRLALQPCQVCPCVQDSKWAMHWQGRGTEYKVLVRTVLPVL